jgi:MFS family permease
MVAGPGSATFVALSGSLAHAGVFVALTYIGAACGAALGGLAMDRFGRKMPLVFAYSLSAVGFSIAGFGATLAQLALFVTGTLLLAAAFGAINLTRISAAEMFPPAERGRGVAWIQISAIFGAVTGPLLLMLSRPLGNLIGRPPLELVWFLAPPLLLAAALVVSRAEEPRAVAERVAAAGARAAAAVASAAGAPTPAHAAVTDMRLVFAGAITLAASQAAMAAVMGVAGAAVAHAGHGVNVLGGLMFMHFVGMFGLSRLVGGFADKFGRRVTMSMGLALLVCGGLTVALLQGPTGFGVGLLLVGFGWSFGFIGASVLLTDVTAPAHRAGLIGRADLAAQLTSAVIAIGGGWWFAQHGVAGLGILAVCIAAIPLLALFAVVKESAPGSYARVTA